MIIPTRNRPVLLRRCLQAILESVTAAHFEVIVVNNGGKIERSGPLADSRVRIDVAYGNGPACARNVGILSARGDIVLFTDDDAVPDKEWLQAAYDCLTRNPDALGVEGQVRTPPFDLLYEHSVSSDSGGAYLTSNIAYRRRALLAVGGFDTAFPYPHCEDRDLGYRVARLGEVLYEPSMVVVHPPRPIPLVGLVLRARMIVSEWVLSQRHPESRDTKYPYRWAPVLRITGRWYKTFLVEREKELNIRRFFRLLVCATGQVLVALAVTVRGPKRYAVPREAAPSVEACDGTYADNAGKYWDTRAAARTETGQAEDTSVAVVVPTYRRPAHLHRCLQGLAGQEVEAAEILVVARVGDTPTWDLIRQWERRLPYLRGVPVTEPGVIAALSRGIACSTAPLIAITDDDASPRRSWIRELTVHFADPALGAVGGRDAVAGQDTPNSSRVGTFTSLGKFIGNHHVGVGNPRPVAVLKGVNMAFRAEALALPTPHLFRGIGAQPHFEFILCGWARHRGWQVLYDPAIVVDHDPAPRFGPDQRYKPALSAVYDAAHNFAFATAVISKRRVGISAAYSLLVGSRAQPGFVHALLGIARLDKETVRRCPAAIAGTVAGLVLSQQVGLIDDAVITASELRQNGARRG